MQIPPLAGKEYFVGAWRAVPSKSNKLYNVGQTFRFAFLLGFIIHRSLCKPKGLPYKNMR